MRLQTILNYRLQTDSFPPQNSTATHYIHKKRHRAEPFPPNSSATYSTKHNHRGQSLWPHSSDSWCVSLAYDSTPCGQRMYFPHPLQTSVPSQLELQKQKSKRILCPAGEAAGGLQCWAAGQHALPQGCSSAPLSFKKGQMFFISVLFAEWLKGNKMKSKTSTFLPAFACCHSFPSMLYLSISAFKHTSCVSIPQQNCAELQGLEQGEEEREKSWGSITSIRSWSFFVKRSN